MSNRSCNINQAGEQNKVTETREITLWLSNSEKALYINLYQTILESYKEVNKLVFNNMEQRFKMYQDEVRNELEKIYSGDIEISDIIEEAGNRLDLYKLMEYQYHFSSLVNLYQVFEQQIRKYLYKELNHPLSNVRTKENMDAFATKFGNLRKILNELNYPLEKMSWPIIDELNKIANTYKHGDGTSAKRLFLKNKDIFVNEITRFFYYAEPRSKEEEQEYKASLDEEELKKYKEQEKILLMERELTTNMEIVLRIDNTPIEKYVNAIIDFWEKIPEYHTVSVEVE